MSSVTSPVGEIFHSTTALPNPPRLLRPAPPAAREGGRPVSVMEVEVEEPSPSSSSLSSPAGSLRIHRPQLPCRSSEGAQVGAGVTGARAPAAACAPDPDAAAPACGGGGGGGGDLGTSADDDARPVGRAGDDAAAGVASESRRGRCPSGSTTCLANLYFSSAGAGAIVPAPAPGSAAPAVVQSGAGRVPSELVRVSSLGVRDQIYFRDPCAPGAHHLRTTSVPSPSASRASPGSAAGGRDRRRVRADLRAAALMADHDLWLNRDRPHRGAHAWNLGGLCVLGLHGQVQAGIDYVTAGQSASGEPIATSIIVSGGYEDDDDRGDVLVYTGHGGRDPNLHRQCVDQKLEGGNLALERSMAYGIEIRTQPCRQGIFYDGLYKVVDYWLDQTLEANVAMSHDP
ncbi:hypothetical protein HU200_014144 [Digitaria exilis]|uniref:YDG domain-containing protein n=1 Tax=Digitaria exilis TaxID=1010633 RepID=A0A835KKF5_9POAL|nr:hypothetical protein HU200_014144 [Digitaria exilis]